MRILLHDYSGHPFQVQLSRELARRGHQVLHVFSASFQTPKGNLRTLADDAPGFYIASVSLAQPFAKQSFLKRRGQEIEIGRMVAEKIAAFRPDVVISSNAPLDTQQQILRATRAVGARFVFWLQDIYSEAIRRILGQKLPVVGPLVGAYYHRLEYHLLTQSDRIVAISDDFVGTLVRHGIDARRVVIIENWAPMDDIVPMLRDNAWANANMPASGFRIVYSGTLGYKHNPGLLLDLARAIDGHVYVFSEGAAARSLELEATRAGVANLSVRGWVPFEQLSSMLSGADLVVAMIEPDAGSFSVPSKVLSYLSAGRPIAAAIPEGNLARKIILREDAGIVVSPSEKDQLVAEVRQLAADPERLRRMGENGRAFAIKAFDIVAIGDRFERILDGVGSSATEPVTQLARQPV